MDNPNDRVKTIKLKTNFKVTTKHEAFYTGGKILFSEKQDCMLCSCAEKIQIVDVNTGKVIQTISEEGDTISCFALSPDNEILVTINKSLLLKQWDWRNNKCSRSWKAINKAPISCMEFDHSSTLIAMGSSDSTIKLWDVFKQYYTHNLKGSSGVISLVRFHPDANKLQLFSASDDCHIRVWDLVKSRCISVLEGHFSIITSITFSDMGNVMISSARDNVINIWDLPNRKVSHTIPTFEAIESVVVLPQGVSLPNTTSLGNDKYLLTCGNKGILKVWNLNTRKCVHEQPIYNADLSDKESGVIVQAIVCKAIERIAIITFDHNIILYDFNGLKQTKQFVGYNDEILAMKFLGSSHEQAVVASNSNQVRLYNLSTMNCQLLTGHSDIVLSLDVFADGELLLTGSKDNSIRVWQRHEPSGYMVCVGVGYGHTLAVSCVACAKVKSNFVVSGSQDLTIKVWSTENDWQANNITKIDVKHTTKAHDKDINSMAVSPNDKLIATGSQDKTAKIWRASDLTLLGSMRGHRRGIWCVVFSPIDQCLATASGDTMIKLWSLADFTCLKTLEGHANSVLQIHFLTRGMQLLSSDSDGLVKLWTVKTSECIKTLDEHSDKVWSVALSNSGQVMLSAGADSNLNVWKDVTEEEENIIRQAAENQVMKEQELMNLLQQKHFTKAIGLALTLEQPFRTLTIIKDMLFLENGKSELEKTLQGLREDQIDIIMKFLCGWNTNAKHSHVVQTVLSVILRQRSPKWLCRRPEMKERIEALLPYTERHFERTSRLVQQSMFVNYTWQAMKLTSLKNDDMEQ